MQGASFSLRVVSGPGVSNSCVLSHESPLSFGRLECNDCVLANDAAISRKHFEISFQDGKYWIKDLNSRNGTFLNDHPVLSSELKEGDEIRVGITRLIVNLIQKNQSELAAARLNISKSRIAITDSQSTTFLQRKLHSARIARQKLLDDSFLDAFLDLPGSAVLTTNAAVQMLASKPPEAIEIDADSCLLFPNKRSELKSLLENESAHSMLLNYNTARSKFVAHITDCIHKFGSENFLAEYQELPTELANSLMSGIDLSICETDDAEVSAVIFENQHARWLGSVIAAHLT